MVFCCCPETNRSHSNGVNTSKKETERMVSRAEGTKARPEGEGMEEGTGECDEGGFMEVD